jgi:hypothetical protein
MCCEGICIQSRNDKSRRRAVMAAARGQTCICSETNAPWPPAPLLPALAPRRLPLQSGPQSTMSTNRRWDGVEEMKDGKEEMLPEFARGKRSVGSQRGPRGLAMSSAGSPSVDSVFERGTLK